VGLIASLPVSSQILSQKQVAQAVFTQGLRKGLSLEMGKLAGGKAAHVDDHLNRVRSQEVNKLL